MKEISGIKTSKGKLTRSIITSKNMPNQDKKRIRKTNSTDEVKNNSYIRTHINSIGMSSAVMTFFYIPLDLPWKLAIAALFIISSIHIWEEEE